MKTDLDKIKDKYGEKFMHLCRSCFPTLIEKGILFETITKLFHPTRDLFDDIQREGLENEFKSYVLSHVKLDEERAISQPEKTETPFELMRKAGYTLYRCETAEDVMAFREFWADNEPLCTFGSPSERLQRCDVFFAVKDGALPFVKDKNGRVIQEGSINGQARSGFKKPLRQDEYGTSVIGIQFSKQKPQTISIKNRYNHTVANPDSTFSNDLENIQAGLTDAFVQEYGYDFSATTRGFELSSYALASDGKQYKYNLEINGNYYCADNIAIIDGQVQTYDKSRYELVDYFLIDKVERKVIDLTARRGWNDELYSDPFCDAFEGYQKMDIKKVENGREFVVTLASGEIARFTVDKSNQIVSYTNESLTEAGNNFLAFNAKLAELNLPNLTKTESNFLRYNEGLKNLNLPKLAQAGDYFLCSNNNLSEFNAPNLTEVGDNCLTHCYSLTKLDLPSLTYIGRKFLFVNRILTDFNAPKLIEVGCDFLYENGANNWRGASLKKFNAPNLTKIGDGFLELHPKRDKFLKKIRRREK